MYTAVPVLPASLDRYRFTSPYQRGEPITRRERVAGNAAPAPAAISRQLGRVNTEKADMFVAKAERVAIDDGESSGEEDGVDHQRP